MKYLISGLIVIGGLVLIIAIGTFFFFVVDKIKEFESDFEWKHKKYHNFKERILPWMIIIPIFGVFIFCLIMIYLDILSKF